jgi:two-component system, NtrC family, sensor histidine kinase PilS
MSQYGYALMGLTALIAVIVGAVTFALLRLGAGLRDTKRHLGSGSGAETAFLSAALQQAVEKLKAQEQAMSARAAAVEELSGQIVASLTAGLLVTDASGRVSILNPAGRRLLGIESDPVGVDVHRVLEVAPPLAAVIDECMTSGAPIVRRSLAMPASSRASHFGVTVSLLTSAGDSASPRPAADGGNAGVICLFSDLTAVYDLEEQLRLKETLARLGELTAGIAHEFRNGLATIHGYARLIEPEALPAPYRPYMDGIRQETTALGQVVTNFLNFARPEQVSFVSTELAAVIQRAVDDMRHELPAAAEIAVSGEFGRVEGDEVLLKQAFSNLLRNAADAAGEAGRSARIAVNGEIDSRRGVCRVDVDDNGPGIRADVRDKVFRPFFTTRSRGTGLGLAIVQKIVLTHNGKVTVGESPAGGARFQLTFRLAS